MHQRTWEAEGYEQDLHIMSPAHDYGHHCCPDTGWNSSRVPLHGFHTDSRLLSEVSPTVAKRVSVFDSLTLARDAGVQLLGALGCTSPSIT